MPKKKNSNDNEKKNLKIKQEIPAILLLFIALSIFILSHTLTLDAKALGNNLILISSN